MTTISPLAYKPPLDAAREHPLTATIPPPSRVDSSIARASLHQDPLFEIPLTKPTLLPPAQLGILQRVNRLEELADERLSIQERQIDTHVNRIKTLSHQHLRELEKAAKSVDSSLFWSTLRKMGSAILATFSFILGTAVASSGGSLLVSGALISSGMLSLTNFAFTETGIWEKAAYQLYPEDAKKRAQFLLLVPASVGLASAGLGAVGGYFAYTGGAVDIGGKLLQTIHATANTANGMALLGEGFAKAKVNFATADAQKTELTIFQEEHLLDQINRRFEHIFSTLSKGYKSASQIIHLSNEASASITLMG